MESSENCTENGSLIFLNNQDLLMEMKDVSLNQAFKIVSNPSKKYSGNSVLVFRNAICPYNIDYRRYLNSKVIFEENLEKISNGIYVKQSLKVTKKRMPLVIDQLLDSPKDRRNASQDLNILFSELFHHAVKNSTKNYYARDIEAGPIECNSFLEHVPSLLNSREKLSGINSPMYYVGGKASNTVLHDEDSSLGSINLLIGGEPKLWLAIDHTMRAKLLEAFSNYLNIQQKKNYCPTELLHKLYVITPTLLNHWGINYVIFKQNAGDLIFLKGGTCHFVINTGTNIAEAINVANHDWNSHIGIQMPACLCQESRHVDIDRDRTVYSVATPSSSKWYVCSEMNCNQRFKTKRNYETHLFTTHKQIKDFTCDICDKHFINKESFKRHRDNHFGMQNAKECNVCKKQFKNIYLHKLTHSKDYYEECPICKTKITKKNLPRHVTKCNIKCSICGKICRSQRYLTQHQRVHK